MTRESPEPEVPLMVYLGCWRRHLRLGLNDPNGDDLRRSRRCTCVAEKVTCFPGAVNVTRAELEVVSDHVASAKMEMGDRSRDCYRTGSGVLVT